MATATGLGALLATGMTGCFSNNQQQQEENKAKNAFKSPKVNHGYFFSVTVIR